MPIRIGNINLKRRFRGVNEIHLVYRGAVLLYKSITQFVTDFTTRVTADGGAVESTANAITLMQDLRDKDVFEDATFVMIPSGVRSTRVAVQKPESPYNLLQRSEEFDNNYYSKALGTLTPNTSTAPDGTMTADTFIKTSGVNTVSQIRTSSSPYKRVGVYTLSVYFKDIDAGQVLTRLDNDNNTCNSSFFFSTKTFSNSGVNFISSSYEELVDGWFRIRLTGNVVSTAWNVSVCNLFPNAQNTSILVWGAMLNEGSAALPYQKTIDTDFDLTFTRASTATFVNQQGVIETSPRNLLQRSEEFDNASWSKVRTTIVPNSAISPNGQTTADKLIPNTEDNQHDVRADLVAFGKATFSCYFKAAEYSVVSLYFTVSADRASFDLNTVQVVAVVGAGAVANIVDVGNGWRRCSLYSNVGTATGVRIYIDKYPLFQFFAGDNIGGLFAWGAQLEQSPTATSYLPTTDRLNHPRIDHSSGVPALLLEPQRSNLITWSDDVSNAAYTLNNAATTTGAQQVNGADGSSFFSQIVNGSTSTVYTYSIKVKNVNSQRFKLQIRNTVTAFECDFLLTGQYITSTVLLTGSAPSYILNADGFYYITITYTSIESVQRLRVYPSMIGTNTSVLVKNHQLEQGSYPTSYIPTTTATVTRVSDYCSSQVNSSLFNSLEGSIFLECKALSNDETERYITISDGSQSTNVIKIGFRTGSSNSIHYRVIVNGVNSVFTVYTAVPVINMNKMLFKYKQNEFKVFVNGVKVFEQLSGVTFPAGVLNRLNFSEGNSVANTFFAYIKQLTYFKTALTDAQCVALTQ